MWDWISVLHEVKSSGRSAVLVTLTGHNGSSPREAGAKMLVYAGGEFAGTVGGGRLEELALRDAGECLRSGESKTIRYPLGAKTGQCCGGVVDLFFDVINTGPELYLFGAGHVGQALCRVLAGTPFTIHLIDDRREWVDAPELPEGIVKHCVEWDEFVREARWDGRRTYVAVMTYRHDLDQAIVEEVVKRDARYIGLIGSRAKWDRFRQRFDARSLAAVSFERVRCPIGLELGGGKSPQEVAISIAAELLRDHYAR